MTIQAKSESEQSKHLQEVVALLGEKDSSDLGRAMDLAAKSLPQPLGLAVIRSLAFHPNSCVREDAAEWLAEFGVEEDEYRIALLSHDADWSVRCTAASCLAEFKTPSSRARLRQMAARDRVYVVRKWAVTALFDVGDDGTLVSFLHGVLQTEKNPFVRLVALTSLARSGERARKEEMLKLRENAFLKNQRLRSLFEENLTSCISDLEQV